MSKNSTMHYHKTLFALAIPMVLSNITVPLLGLVDTAVLGHLSHAYFLGGSTVGAMLITFISWLCGFLRMSTTGLAAQSFGAKNKQENLSVLIRGLLVAISIGVLCILLSHYYIQAGLWLAGGSDEVKLYAEQYSKIRIWGLPAALGNLVLLGWLLGNQQTKTVMWLLIFTNVCNLILDLWFVLGLNWQVKGVASATLIAEYLGFLLGLSLIFKDKKWLKRFMLIYQHKAHSLWSVNKVRDYFALNRDILLRTLCLELCFLFITFQGARMGDEVVAANAILLNFLLLVSFGLDGIANGAEALVGEAKGEKNIAKIQQVVSVSLCWTAVLALCYSAAFMMFGPQLVALMTSIPDVAEYANQHLVWLWLLPVLACWCYLFDGVYIGLTEAKAMRNSMIASTFLGFFPLWFITQGLNNHAIWFAFCCFMILRGVTLAWHYHYKLLPKLHRNAD